MPDITLASPPSRASAPVDYVTRMDAWLGGDLQNLVAQINSLDASDWFSVQSSPTDDTPGKVMTVGAFGLGASGGSGHLAQYQDAADVSQLLADGVTSDPPDKPTTGRGHVGMHFAHTADRWFQIMAEVAGGTDLSRLWWRRNHSGQLSSWAALLSSDTPAGALGSPAFARNDSGGTLAYGDEVAGASIRTASSSGAGGGALSGTWMCLGHAGAGETTYFRRVA